MSGGLARLVKDVMTREVLAVSPSTSVYRTAILMAERGVGSCVILSDEKLVGIVTERDFVRRVLAKGLPPRRTRVEKIMTSPVTVIGENATLEEAIEVMADQNVKRLVVVGDSGVTGIISVSDLIKVMGKTEADLSRLPRIFLARETER
ncbi:Hypoxic response protein 1 [archaeon HR01]|nr:Hypoxic response protein 1 [archaeon HR01]